MGASALGRVPLAACPPVSSTRAGWPTSSEAGNTRVTTLRTLRPQGGLEPSPEVGLQYSGSAQVTTAIAALSAHQVARIGPLVPDLALGRDPHSLLDSLVCLHFRHGAFRLIPSSQQRWSPVF